MTIQEQERYAYSLGLMDTAAALPAADDYEIEASKAERMAADAQDEIAALKRQLACVVQAAEHFALDSEMDAKAQRQLMSVLDNAKDST